MQQNSENFSIKKWSLDDRPREKLLHKGKDALSDAELVAILIGSGSRNESAVALSKRILASVDHNLNALGKLSVGQLMKFKGIGEAKAVSIAAATELGRRRQSDKAEEPTKITGSNAVFRLLQPILGELPHEEFWILYLNNSNKVLHKHQLSKGGMTGTLVDVRLVLKLALERGAVSLILAHNHPSGGLRPSQADKDITTKLKVAAASLDIKVLDHLIITENSYFSFADEGLL
ncbi:MULTISPECIES: RadC family protein [Leeuwenhoekiella]|uniref:Putative DNA repair protein n=1 Tax=Leeuwenhoekiella blandensis (strain CECT 7118 / CCUG 51940 / KCTC 22103 / MED217) TaxID=398720 RepID=A3XQW7_LEEBM|nr:MULTISPECIES: DNA repair protein RadC [Leeuwenhoekiella]EAQ48121.1 putative DNA repair protein [Leeuwenhoekiella blandensis MED217]MAO43716.1 JAB domain-containing protein [Leeuwenhoekiella sp.]MBQ52505.1 JAB domain-containing protein [Leeuwenhoekiella sp.]HBT10564.1 JAB domain-containing protein [Leeuwenhoekiella sp.]|tara:strand:+ start:193 stop:891 length:699 start_codon:yes stop_codon:yes gene_type:complete